MASSVTIRAAATVTGERLSVAAATPMIQTATVTAPTGRLQLRLWEFLPVYTMYIPRPRDRKLKKYSAAGQDIKPPCTIIKAF
jgi:hypothetical protein